MMIFHSWPYFLVLKTLTKPTADRHGHGGSDRSGDRYISKSASTSLLLANDPIILTKAPPKKSGRSHTTLCFPIFFQVKQPYGSIWA